MDNYYRIPSDTRDLNYNQYFEEGEVITEATDYHSHNTKRLDEVEMKEMILNLHEVQSELKEFGISKI
jgi:UDP-glucose 4-epimerase